MNKDKYGEVINGEETYKKIAETLLKKGSCIIGWTDQGYDHRDILFTLRPPKFGTLQRGLNWNSHLYISIMDGCSMGFLLEYRTNNTKDIGYIKEKLRLNDNSCDDKICELINGVIKEIDVLEEGGVLCDSID